MNAFEVIGKKMKLLAPSAGNNDAYEKSPFAADRMAGQSPGANTPQNPMNFTYPSGSTPLPRYTIRRGVGVGGFGEVYFAVSEAGKEVALKRIQRNLDVELRGVSQCLNLKHPNLVSLHDVCHDEDGQAWVVMEYMAGPNLRDVLDDYPHGLPEDDARHWFAGLAAGVAHLHRSGLVHRDLKPGNVFQDAGIIKIGDYGLSKFISSSRRGGQTESVGTFHYMAPEVARGEYGREIDLYALGIILCELLTGRVPFDGESSHEIVMKHLTALPDLKGVPEPYRGVIDRALQKDPHRRPDSVAEMVAPLGIAFDHYGIARLTAEKRPASSAASAADGPAVITAKAVDSPRETPVATGCRNGAIPVAALRTEGAAAITVPSLGRTNEEPLARALRASANDLGGWWKSLDSAPGTRFLLAALAVIVLVMNTHWLLPLLSLVAIVYVPYYVVRQMIGGIERQPTFAEAHRQSVVRQSTPRPISRQEWQQRKRTALAAKNSLTRVTELSGSWTRAGLTTASLGGFAGLLGLRNSEINALNIAPYAFVAVGIALASAAVLGLGKLWERDQGEGLPRRLVLLGVGAGVGAIVYGLANFLMIPMDEGMAAIGVHSNEFASNLYAADGTPLLPAMMAHFAILFAGLRWWKNTDPLRRRRLSLWSIAVVVVAEWALQQVLPIPQPWGMLAAGGTALIVQLSAPWENPRQPLRETEVC